MKTIMTVLLSLLSLLNFSCAEQNASEPQTSAPKIEIENELIQSEKESTKTDVVDIVSAASEVWDQSSVDVESSSSEPKQMVENQDVIEEEDFDTSSNSADMNDEVPEAMVKTVVQAEEEEMASEEKEVEEFLNHDAFNTLLNKHVSSSGVVDYKGFKSDLSTLDAYLKDLAANPVASSWSRNEKLAYWINAYNAFTIKLILDNYPVSSIQDIAGGKPWDKKWIVLGGETYSLNQIENEIIRPQFNEARIHFAVNCAAQSCPPLANQAFTADNLNALLDKQTKAFINNSKYNQISGNSAKVSKIFDWYGQDFGDLKSFLNKYSSSTIKSGAKISYNEYDWALNNK